MISLLPKPRSVQGNGDDQLLDIELASKDTWIFLNKRFNQITFIMDPHG